MKKLLIAAVILLSCLMTSITFATTYYATANIYVVDPSYTSLCTYDIQIGVQTEYPSWSGWVYYYTGYNPGSAPFPLSISVTLPGPIPYNTQTTDYYKVVVQVTKHIWLTKYSFSTGMGLCR